MPEPLRDLKGALRRAKERRFRSLREMAEAAGISPDTASTAINGTTLPTRATVAKIRAACGARVLDDGRYDDWNALYRAAARSRPAGPVNGRSPRRSGGPAASVLRTSDGLPGGDSYEATRAALDRYHGRALDRDADLADILERLQRASGYHIVTGSAFAGKTAMVVELYRRLRRLGWPVCVFYVMHGSQDRAEQFLRAVTGQLLATLGRAESVAAGAELTAQFQRLWQEFTALGVADAPAVLLVDGLDEQSAAEPISPLLPWGVAEHAAVLVSTRPSPDHRYSVPPFHPLASAPCSAVLLDPSPHARLTATEAERHLGEFLETAPVHVEVAGLLALAGAPLTKVDLAEILHLGPGEVGACLRQVARCVLPIHGVDGTPTYQWAHEQYHRYVGAFVGTRRYRDRIIERILLWSDHYAEQRWPVTTPPYLLTELPRLLRDSAREDRMARLCALTDDRRRQVIREVFGHDRPFLEVLDLIRSELLARPPHQRDLRQLFQVELLNLVVNSSVLLLPDGFLTVLVRAGRIEQARGLALCMEEKERAAALAEISQALDRADPTAAAVAADASAYAEATYGDDYWRIRSRCDAVRAVHRATGVVPPLDWSEHPAERDQAVLSVLAGLHADLGRSAGAWPLVRELLSSRTDRLYGWVVADLARTAATLGDLDLALDLALKAPIDRVVVARNAGKRLQHVVTLLTLAGRENDAHRVAEAIRWNDGGLRAAVDSALCRALGARGERDAGRVVLDAALEEAAQLGYGPARALSLAHLAGGMAALGDTVAAAQLVESLLLDPVLEQDEDGEQMELSVLTQLAAVCLELGEHDRAREVCDRTLRAHLRASTPFLDESLAELTSALIVAGRPHAAAAVLPAIRNRAHRAPADRRVAIAGAARGGAVPVPGALRHWPPQDRIRLAESLITGGRHAEAQALAEQVVASSTDSEHHLLPHAIEVLLSSGATSEALTAAGRIGRPEVRTRTFARLASLRAREGHEQAARTFGDDALRAALKIRSRASRLSALCAVIEILGGAPILRSHLDRAAAACRALVDTAAGSSSLVLARTSIACLKAGCPEAGLPAAREMAAAASRDRWQGLSVDDVPAVVECLARSGLTDELRQLLDDCTGDFSAFWGAANVCTETGAWTEAAGFARAARTYADHWDLRNEAALRVLLAAFGHVGEVGSAMELLARYDGHEKAGLLGALVGALVESGHAGPGLEAAVSLPNLYNRGAGLVAWAVSPAWSSPLREELLELLVDRVVEYVDASSGGAITLGAAAGGPPAGQR